MPKLHERWESKTKELEKTVSYRTESIALDVALQVFDRLKELKINRKQLAERLNVSRSYVSQILGGKPNLTLQTLVKITDALDMELGIEFRKTAPSHTIPFLSSEGEKKELKFVLVDTSELYSKPKEQEIELLQTADDSFGKELGVVAR